jgi:uracil phosphoribosyltransferase
VIEDEGSLVSFPVKHSLRRLIRAQANLLMTRQFAQQREASGHEYHYRIAQPAVGPEFGTKQLPVLFLDPTLATGGSILAAIAWLEEQIELSIALERVHVWTLCAAPLGIERLCSTGATIVTAKVADGLNDRGYITDGRKEWIGNMADFLAQNCMRTH